MVESASKCPVTCFFQKRFWTLKRFFFSMIYNHKAEDMIWRGNLSHSFLAVLNQRFVTRFGANLKPPYSLHLYLSLY